MLHHEKLDVYQCAVRFLALSGRLATKAPRGHAALADQLRRAALSIPLNMAEAAGRVTAQDSSRHFTIARGPALECAAVLDACQILGMGSPAQIQEGKVLLERAGRAGRPRSQGQYKVAARGLSLCSAS